MTTDREKEIRRGANNCPCSECAKVKEVLSALDDARELLKEIRNISTISNYTKNRIDQMIGGA